MITSFQLNFGKAPDVPSEEIPVTPVTVLSDLITQVKAVFFERWNTIAAMDRRKQIRYCSQI
jgi:hypothetical protein